MIRAVPHRSCGPAAPGEDGHPARRVSAGGVHAAGQDHPQEVAVALDGDVVASGGVVEYNPTIAGILSEKIEKPVEKKPKK